MSASYPTSKKTWTDKVDGVDDVMAAHVNDLYAEVIAIEDDLIIDSYHSIYKSNLDSNGIYTTVEYKRADASLMYKSVLSGGTSPEYTTKTETKYAADGETEIWSKVYTLSYDSNGNVSSEVLST